ncbi:type II toxin-antitoxin system RelE/ParE family toxin [Treponema parvum]|uniref:Type II toxin-antitoxin system RelE/ParE family toxin n=1 Tax=Treponema parvum TaxID=138851 RepID=A0A975F5D8_9SPIR|nr:type II toxin-antitoxin system RelE/ParE family toxin [Treponema parvum]QTQ14613.1 type II toxin-antitoxin system RelE/ParE family toxin [Treponema parvum]
MVIGYEIEFYKTESGKNPVNEFIQSLQKKQIAKILRDITLLQEMGSDLHYPYVDFIKGDRYAGLMELRTKQSNNIFRIFYFVVVKDKETKEEKAVLLHAIQKKTDKTPQKELETVLARMKDYKSRGSCYGRF